ncbi:transposase family protein [Streptomyces sp. NPDC019890]|uniref:transposase family protein n=1 Tax=Streptomyces sp. NPDC019890 TaxID=3365064 RepID=UPI00384AB383
MSTTATEQGASWSLQRGHRHRHRDRCGLRLPGCRRNHPHPGQTPEGQEQQRHEKRANRAHTKLRVPIERAFAVLKRWRILDLVRLSPNRITGLLHALLAIVQKRSSLDRA